MEEAIEELSIKYNKNRKLIYKMFIEALSLDFTLEESFDLIEKFILNYD